MIDRTRCGYKRTDGNKCRNFAKSGSDQCHWHGKPLAAAPAFPSATIAGTATQVDFAELQARDARRVRDEVGLSASDELRSTHVELRRATDALAMANQRISELEATKTPEGRAAIYEAHARRNADDLARALARVEFVNAEIDKQRALGDQTARALDAETARALAAEQRLVEVVAELAELRSAREGLDADMAAGTQLLHERACDILLGIDPPTVEQRHTAEAATRLADSLIAFARERRRSAQPTRHRSPARARSAANGDARAGAADEGNH